jgi:hypothetical protein
MDMLQDLLAQANLGTYAGIGLVTIVLIGALKGMLKTWMAGKEPFFAFLLPVAMGIASKATGTGFAEDGYFHLVVYGLLTGVGAQVSYDKAWPLVKSSLGGLWSGSAAVKSQKK